MTLCQFGPRELAGDQEGGGQVSHQVISQTNVRSLYLGYRLLSDLNLASKIFWLVRDGWFLESTQWLPVSVDKFYL